MVKIIFLIGTGSFIGGVSRFLVGHWVHKFLPTGFPYGTLSVNVSGCFLIGIVLGLAGRGYISPEWRFFLATGFCGGFTTFSTFAYENIHLLGQREYFYLFLYSLLSYAIGLIATWLGIALGR